MSKGKGKKVNPRRIPVSLADVEKTRTSTLDQAVQNAMAIFFTVLKDKTDMSNEELLFIWQCVNKLSGEIKEGRVSFTDLKHVLSEEYGVEIG